MLFGGNEMKKDQEFASEIKALYETQGGNGRDLRSAELMTMLDVFLGTTYDQAKKDEIAKIQGDLHRKQESLTSKFRGGALEADEYLTMLNSLIGGAFTECERVLGAEDFTRLFGVTPTAQGDFVDRQAFAAIAPNSAQPAAHRSALRKAQVVSLIAKKIGTSNKATAALFECLAEVAIVETKKTGVFVLPGLGRLRKVQRKARMSRNPQTGQPIKFASKTTAKFYLAKAVKDSISPKK